MEDEQSRVVFVTVGTYKFDELVQEVSKPEFQKVSILWSHLLVAVAPLSLYSHFMILLKFPKIWCVHVQKLRIKVAWT